ncbi:MAG: ATP-binding protein [Clostridia bacterium]|nr:ATP-binding protein [Clostridia bacterium]
MEFEISDFSTLQTAGQELADFLRRMEVSEDRIFDSRLVLAELVSNVLRHAHCVAVVKGKVSNGRIELEVTSAEKYAPPDKSNLPDCYAEHGRGLYIVDRLSESRIITPEGGIRVVISARRASNSPSSAEDDEENK